MICNKITVWRVSRFQISEFSVLSYLKLLCSKIKALAAEKISDFWILCHACLKLLCSKVAALAAKKNSDFWILCAVISQTFLEPSIPANQRSQASRPIRGNVHQMFGNFELLPTEELPPPKIFFFCTRCVGRCNFYSKVFHEWHVIGHTLLT